MAMPQQRIRKSHHLSQIELEEDRDDIEGDDIEEDHDDNHWKIAPTDSTVPSEEESCGGGPLPKIKDHEVKLGLIPQLLVRDMHVNDALRIQKTLKKLADLIQDEKKSAEQAQQIVKMGGHLAVVTAMDKWRGQATTQIEGCRVLANLLNCGQRDFVEGVAALGGIEIILTAMKSFPDTVKVQIMGCRSLNALTIHCEANAELLVRRYAGLDVVMQSMLRFPDNVNMQGNACRLFRNLCEFGETMKQSIIALGAVSAVAAVIEKHAENKKVQTYARDAMKHML